MSNLPPGSNAGAEPRGHDDRCRVNCPYDLVDNGSGEIECGANHFNHDCTCDDLAELDAYAAAEAWCDGWETRL